MVRNIALALALFFVPSVASAQRSVTVVDMNGNISRYSVRSTDLTPKTLRIKPYGMNLQPMQQQPRRRPPVTFNPNAYGGGPVTIKNPYYREPEESWVSQTNWLEVLVFIFLK